MGMAYKRGGPIIPKCVEMTNILSMYYSLISSVFHFISLIAFISLMFIVHGVQSTCM